MNWNQSLEVYIVMVVLLGAIPANAYPAEYSRLPWRSSEVGRAMMNKGVAIALLFDLSLVVAGVRLLSGEQWWLDLFRAVVFTYVVGAITFQWRVVRRYRKAAKAAARVNAEESR